MTKLIITLEKDADVGTVLGALTVLEEDNELAGDFTSISVSHSDSELTDEEAQAIGEALEKELILRRCRDHRDRFDCAGGSKTHKGLARTVQRIIDHR